MKIPRLWFGPVCVVYVASMFVGVKLLTQSPQQQFQTIIFTNGMTVTTNLARWIVFIETNSPPYLALKTNRSNGTLSIERADGEPSRRTGFDVLRTNSDGTIYILRPDGSTIRAVLADPETNQDQIVQTWDNWQGSIVPIPAADPFSVTFSGFTVHLVPETNSDTLLPMQIGTNKYFHFLHPPYGDSQVGIDE